MITLTTDTTKAVFFDLNGTLIRDRDIHRQNFSSLLKEYGLELDKQEYDLKVDNRLNRDIWVNLFGNCVSEAELEALSVIQERRYFQLMPLNITLTPGAQSLLVALVTMDIPIFLVSSAPENVVRFVLQRLQLEDVFTQVITGSMVHKGKPDPEIYKLALETSKCTADQILTFEDSPQGALSSMGAGLRTVGVLPEYTKQELSDVGITEFINDFTEIEVIIN